MNHFSGKLCLFSFFILLVSCSQKKKSEMVWVKTIYQIGSQSSPRTTDLNQDGILDIVMGAGLNEYQKSDHGIFALDGKTGELLWKQEAPDQVYGSATLYDVTMDGVDDIFIGGRSPHFKALDGKTGEVIWEYQYIYQNDSILKYARFNFNNSVLIPDQNGDGLQELLTVNGGNSEAAPNSEINRYPGVMIIFNSKTGEIMAADTMPDGGESYMSPIVLAQPDEKEHDIVFGTGGETISGNLYIAKLADLVKRKLGNAKIVASEKKHGFIAPPSAADINKDGYLDIVAISHGSTAFAIDGKDQNILWTKKFPDTECSNSFAVGNFTDDDVPDFFTFVSKGVWPNSTGSLQVMLDGKSGQIVYQDSIGCTGFSSPVVYDLNHDGWDEAIISINEFDCSVGFVGEQPSTLDNKLISIDFRTRLPQVIDQSSNFKNIFSTPWIGDLDGDGYLDIIHCQYYNPQPGNLLFFLGMRVKRIDTPIRLEEEPRWGGYMGSNADGIYHINNQ